MRSSNLERSAAIARCLTVARLIVFALVTGLLIFAGLAVYLRTSGEFGLPAEPGLITQVAILASVPIVVAYFIVPMALARVAARRLAAMNGASFSSMQVGQLYLPRFLVRCALLEGGAFILIVAYLIEGYVGCLVGALICAVVLALQFPTQFGIENWLEKIEGQAAQDRLAMRTR